MNTEYLIEESLRINEGSSLRFHSRGLLTSVSYNISTAKVSEDLLPRDPFSEQQNVN